MYKLNSGDTNYTMHTPTMVRIHVLSFTNRTIELTVKGLYAGGIYNKVELIVLEDGPPTRNLTITIML